jgi:adenosine kinase
MNIVLTGSVAYDYLMTFPGYFRDHLLPDRLASVSLSFLVDSLIRRRGGIAPNIAYTLALLGGKHRVMATVGEDFEEYRQWLESHGVDTTAMKVIPGIFTASFFANTDRANAQIASFYPGAMAHAAELSFHTLPAPRPDLAVISPNDPGAMEQYIRECRELGIPYLYDPSQQLVRMAGPELRQGIQGAFALFVNDYESGLVEKMTGLDVAGILQYVRLLVITRGEQGSTIYAGGQEVTVPIVPAEKIVDPTGVGDAYRGGFLAGFSRGWDWQTCGQIGALAATYCLEQSGPQSHSFTPTDFITRYRQHFNDHSLLDELLIN